MKYIKNFYSLEKLYIPIEILIYNIVNFSPSPLQADIILDLKSSIEQYQSLGLLPSSRSTIISIKTAEIAPKSITIITLNYNFNKNC